MENDMVKLSAVESRIIEVRGEKVILDSDVAALYGVETREINQAVKNNPEKFPEGYIFKLTKAEKSEVIKIFDNLVAGGENADRIRLKFSPSMPNAFTERGLYMLATILKSRCATQTTIAIVDTFTKIRDLSRTVATLSATDDQYVQKNLMQKSGDIMADILGEDLQTTDTETSMELNLAVLKFKHTIKRKADR